ncbi:ATP-dependent chromatin assembly factor large subunit isoform X2 [Rhynchophorus ferrugineus]|uniref:ATP-dependent chromatin assembly factor large subunit isoform X2 n=1 Tax=Rhynchophorus ferrugineus TaxID=354439 RepID=UPI003FCE8884
MPLLEKKAFERQTVPDFLRDDEEVFFCEITNEIFRDYHEFSERMFLCNSMVWTCSMTGKSNLTYLEALESEENAKQCLKEFPNELKIPILYLAHLTKRNSFGKMFDDIFYYIKDRYFIGESLEASFTANKWKDCHIISVIAPENEELDNLIKYNGSSPSDRSFLPPPNLYKYEIEHLDSEDTDISEIMIVDSLQLRRKKNIFSKDKCKLFLKQYVVQGSGGLFNIKPSIIEKFNINESTWTRIFNGPLPNFQCSKSSDKDVTKKKQKQETLSKYLEKNGILMKKGGDSRPKNSNLLQQMKKREEEFKKMKQLNEEQVAAEKLKKKEEANRQVQILRHWTKTKEDLELEDQKTLPNLLPVKSKCEKYFGDIVVIMEFVHSFQKLLSTKDFFPNGFTLELMERALTEKEISGPLTDLIQMFLLAIFNCQDEESNNYNTGIELVKDINEEKLSVYKLEDLTHFATLASIWSIRYQGLPLNKLPLYPLTVSEILRLHLLSSGAKIKENGAKWRYAQRGGYSSENDPGLHLRLNQTHILKALAVHNVVELSIKDKITIMDCLMNQLLTYADVRDIVEDKIEKARVARVDLRFARGAERRREMEYVAQKVKIKKELKGDVAALEKALEKLTDENESKKFDNQQRMDSLHQAGNEGQVLLGMDRAYRRYYRIESIPGIFINWENSHNGTCLETYTIQYPELTTASRSDLMTHLSKVYEINVTSPSKTPRKINGVRQFLTPSDKDTCHKLLLCTTDPSDCPVHKEGYSESKWFFFMQAEQIDEFIESLNKRGARENELRDFLINEKDNLAKLIKKTPVSLLNPNVQILEMPKDERVRPNGSSKKKDRYDDANLGYPADMDIQEVLENVLIENILEMEEKVSAGALGVLNIKDRELWRNCLQNKNYAEFESLPKGTVEKEFQYYKLKKKDKGKNNSRSSTPEIQEKKEEKEYYDPGKFLGPNSQSEEETDDMTAQNETTKLSIRCLAKALSHIANAVDGRHLKKPLGHADVRLHNKGKDEYDVMERWHQSLAASTSFSQILLHYDTLDSCVMWSRSALIARCQICRRRKDSENMLLCDCCNLGHHMYCLKPKLTMVPKGDWFCDKCKKDREKQDKLSSPEPTKKRRRIFQEGDVEEEEEQDSGNIEDSEVEETSEHDVEEEEEENSEFKIELCKVCRSGGEIVSCDKCHSNYHKECVDPPLRRLPRSPWTCPSCQTKGSKPEKNSKERTTENGYDSVKANGAVKLVGLIGSYSQRRCAAKANVKIQHFVKALGHTDSKFFQDDFDNEVINRRSMRREDGREDLPLHNAALQELLSDVMKHEDAWPFIRPVQQKEVPDYYEIITTPMDFGTIKYKLNVGEYSTDSQLLKDVILVFENCNTYNSSDAEVYKCGVRLLKYFAKKANGIGLKVPPELEVDDNEDTEPKAKKKRTK